MNCSEFRGLFPAALSDALPEELACSFRAHFVDCADCHDVLRRDGVIDGYLALADWRVEPAPGDRRLARRAMRTSTRRMLGVPTWAAVLFFLLVSGLAAWCVGLGLEPAAEVGDQGSGTPAGASVEDPLAPTPPNDRHPTELDRPRLRAIAEAALPPSFSLTRGVGAYGPELDGSGPESTIVVMIEASDPAVSAFVVGRAIATSPYFQEFGGIRTVMCSITRAGRFALTIYITRDHVALLPQSWSGSDYDYCKRYLSPSHPRPHVLGEKPFDSQSILRLLAATKDDVPGAVRRYFEQNPIAIDETVRVGADYRRIVGVNVNADNASVLSFGDRTGASRQSWSDPSGRVEIEVWTE